MEPWGDKNGGQIDKNEALAALGNVACARGFQESQKGAPGSSFVGVFSDLGVFLVPFRTPVGPRGSSKSINFEHNSDIYGSKGWFWNGLNGATDQKAELKIELNMAQKSCLLGT